MPLKDRDKTRPRRLVRLGVIRLGMKKTSSKGVEYPVQAEHFVLTDAPEIAAVYGEKPRELDVILPFPDVARNFDAAYTVWAGGVLVCRGDGEYVDYATPHEIVPRKDGKISVHNAPGDTLVSGGVAQVAFDWNSQHFDPGDHVPCSGADADLYPHCRACKVSAILKVMMARPDLFRLGYYQVATGSGRNYDTILGTLELIREQAGRVNGIPFKLRLVQEPTVYFANDGQRKKTTRWFLQLEPEPNFTRRLYRQAAAAILNETSTQRLPATVPVADEELPFTDWDEAAPPPLAEEGGPAEEPSDDLEVDPHTGEILNSVGEEPESPAGEVEAPSDVAQAAEITTTRGTKLGDLKLDQLQWVIDHPESATPDQLRAATMLRDALAATLDAEPKALTEPKSEMSSAEMTFLKMIQAQQEKLL